MRRNGSRPAHQRSIFEPLVAFLTLLTIVIGIGIIMIQSSSSSLSPINAFFSAPCLYFGFSCGADVCTLSDDALELESRCTNSNIVAESVILGSRRRYWNERRAATRKSDSNNDDIESASALLVVDIEILRLFTASSENDQRLLDQCRGHPSVSRELRESLQTLRNVNVDGPLDLLGHVKAKADDDYKALKDALEQFRSGDKVHRVAFLDMAHRIAFKINADINPFDFASFNAYLKAHLAHVEKATAGLDLRVLHAPTGEGKSTMLHCAGSSTMVETRAGVFQPLIIRTPQLCKTRVADGGGFSTTQFDTLVPIQPPDKLLPLLNASLSYTLPYLDGRGLFDRNGSAVDAANTVAHVHILRRANNVKLIMVLSYQTLTVNNGGALDEQIDTLDAMVSSFEKVVPTLFFVITKWPRHSHPSDDVARVISDLLTAAKSRNNAKRELFLEHLSSPSNRFILNPSDGQRATESLIYGIESSVTTTGFIPPSYFRPFITSKSKPDVLKFAKQVSEQALSQNAYLHSELTFYRLKELRDFCKITKVYKYDTEWQVTYDKTVNQIIESLKSRYEAATTSLKEAMSERKLTGQILKDLMQLLSYFSLGRVIDKLEPNKKIPQVATLVHFIVDTANQDLRRIREILGLQSQESASSTSSPNAVPTLPTSAHEISSAWSRLSQLYELSRVDIGLATTNLRATFTNAVSLVEAAIGTRLDSALKSANHLSRDNAASLRVDLSSLKFAKDACATANLQQEILKQLCVKTASALDNAVNATRTFLTTRVETSTSEALTQCQTNALLLDFGSIQAVHFLLKELHDSSTLADYLPGLIPALIDDLSSQANPSSQIGLCIKNAYIELFKQLDSLPANAAVLFDQLKKHYHQLSDLSAISSSVDLLADFGHHVSTYLASVSTSIGPLLTNSYADKLTDDDVRSLRKYLSVPPWFSTLTSSSSDEESAADKVSRIRQAVIDHFVELESFISGEPFSDACAIFKRAVSLSTLSHFIEEIESKFDQIKAAFQKKLFTELSEIEKNFDWRQYSDSEVSKDLSRLIELQSEFNEKSHASNFLRSLNAPTSVHFQNETKRLETELNATLHNQTLKVDASKRYYNSMLDKLDQTRQSSSSTATQLKELQDLSNDAFRLFQEAEAEASRMQSNLNVLLSTRNNSLACYQLLLAFEVSSLDEVSSTELSAVCPAAVAEARLQDMLSLSQRDMIGRDYKMTTVEFKFDSVDALDNMIDAKQSQLDKLKRELSQRTVPALDFKFTESVLDKLKQMHLRDDVHSASQSKAWLALSVEAQTRVLDVEGSVSKYLTQYFQFNEQQAKLHLQGMKNAHRDATYAHTEPLCDYLKIVKHLMQPGQPGRDLLRSSFIEFHSVLAHDVVDYSSYLKSHLPDIIEHADSLLNHLQTSFVRGQWAVIDHHLQITRACTCLDMHFDQFTHSDNLAYRQLNVRYTDVLNTGRSDTISKISTSVSNKQFESAYDSLVPLLVLGQTPALVADIEYASDLIYNGIKNFIKQVERTDVAHIFDSSFGEAIQLTVRQLCEASVVIEKLQDLSSKSALDDAKAKARTDISVSMTEAASTVSSKLLKTFGELVSRVHALYVTNSYYEAHSKASSLISASKKLESLSACFPDLSDRFNSVQTLHADIMSLAQSNTLTWSSMAPVDYISKMGGVLNPRYLDDEFAHIVRDTDLMHQISGIQPGSSYTIIRTQFEKEVTSQFQTAVDNAQNGPDEQWDFSIAKIRQALLLLPSSWQEKIRQKIEEAARGVIDLREKKLSLIKEACADLSSDSKVEDVRALYDSMKAESSYNILAAFDKCLNNVVDKQAHDIKRILGLLQGSNVVMDLHNALAVIHSILTQFPPVSVSHAPQEDKFFTKLATKGERAQRDSLSFFNKLSLSLVQLMQSLKGQTSVSEQTINNLESNLKLFISFLKLGELPPIKHNLEFTAPEVSASLDALLAQRQSFFDQYLIDTSEWKNGPQLNSELNVAFAFSRLHVLFEALVPRKLTFIFDDMLTKVSNTVVLLQLSAQDVSDRLRNSIVEDPSDPEFHKLHTKLKAALLHLNELAHTDSHFHSDQQPSKIVNTYTTIIYDRLKALASVTIMAKSSLESFDSVHVVAKYLSSLSSFNILDLSRRATDLLDVLNRKMFECVDDAYEAARQVPFDTQPSSQQHHQFSEALVHFQFVVDGLRCAGQLKPSMTDRIDAVINNYMLKDSINGANSINNIYEWLSQQELKGSSYHSMAAVHVLKSSKFAEYLAKRFADKISKRPIDEILQDMEADDFGEEQAQELYLAYQAYDAEFKKQATIRYSEQVHASLSASIRDLALTKFQPSPTLYAVGILQKFLLGQQKELSPWWAGVNREILSTLIGRILALWSLRKSSSFVSVEPIIKPTPAQVVGIFRLLGLGSNKGLQLAPHLVEILTGEGKSIVLAVTAAVLALRGANVRVACYSEDLTSRDAEEFKWLFESLDVANLVYYGTIQAVAENYLNGRGDIRDNVDSVVTGSALTSASTSSSAHISILLMDEVDMFLSEAFYEQSYRPLTQLTSTAFVNLMEDVWSSRLDFRNLDFGTFKNRPSFIACQAEFKKAGAQTLLELALQRLLIDVRQFSSDGHTVCADAQRICYPFNDGQTDKIIKTYITAFSARYEEEQGRLPSGTAAEHYFKFNIVSGQFSYAAIPQQFHVIMGVTGTLRSLSQFEKEVVKDSFGINKETYLPSTYLSSKTAFIDTDLFVVDDASFHSVLADEIRKKLQGTNSDPALQKERAVMVFFDSEISLDAFYRSSYYQSIYAARRLMLTEHDSANHRHEVIERAGISNTVSLITAAFGRGTDFKSHSNVNQNGGTHVIQAFFSAEISEQVQIAGRTGRQGDPGSFSIVISESQLEPFQVTLAELTHLAGTPNARMKRLNEARIEHVQQKSAVRKQLVANSDALHKQSMQFIEDLFGSRNEAGVFDHLASWNRIEYGDFSSSLSTGTNSRMHIMVDATGSMGGELDSVKQYFIRCISEIRSLLDARGMNPNSFAVKFSFYRNYNCAPDKAIVNTAWEKDFSQFTPLLNSIHANCGLGPEAIELALNEAAKDCLSPDTMATRIIIVGDREANSEAEIKAHRTNEKYEPMWKDSAVSLDPWSVYAAKIKPYQIPIYPMYINRASSDQNKKQNSAYERHAELAKKNFEDIAEAMGSQRSVVKQLDLTSTDALATVLGEHIIDDIMKAAHASLADTDAMKADFKHKMSFIRR